MDSNSKTILVTGGAGYVGSTFVRNALFKGYRVRCLDLLIYGGATLVGFINHPNFEFVYGDVRDVTTVRRCLEDVDYVVHLAAIVGDKPCQVAPKSAYQINFKGTEILADLSKAAGKSRFVFASTCSNYGISDPNQLATEESSLNPVSLYAETKIDSESYLNSISDDQFIATSLRFGTAFGASFRTRFDLTVNSFAYEAWTSKEIVVFAADTWRPYVHVLDMCVLMQSVLECDLKAFKGGIYNAGFTSQNYTKRQIVEMLVGLMPELRTKFITSVDDRRDYRVSFKKCESLLKRQPSRTVEDGFRELLHAFQNGLITENEFDANKLDTITDLFGKYEDKLSVPSVSKLGATPE